MVRVQFDANELDQQFQIEDGIRATLLSSTRAALSKTIVNENYGLLDKAGNTMTGTLEQKCDAIAKETETTYLINEQDVVFVPKKTR